eukprot:TRINITY_DN31602_c0_g1_i2.p2 TRINITY_DN31602_c0_g1~~TRINITY_DN31602_c0_g1_i2.p2  ORF type:complete len:188 (+),score=10.40 TRINITY_DN31602_c0_g1_i2:163-726(+)
MRSTHLLWEPLDLPCVLQQLVGAGAEYTWPTANNIKELYSSCDQVSLSWTRPCFGVLSAHAHTTPGTLRDATSAPPAQAPSCTSCLRGLSSFHRLSRLWPRLCPQLNPHSPPRLEHEDGRRALSTAASTWRRDLPAQRLPGRSWRCMRSSQRASESHVFTKLLASAPIGFTFASKAAARSFGSGSTI